MTTPLPDVPPDRVTGMRAGVGERPRSGSV
jgi:hypothetical protein